MSNPLVSGSWKVSTCSMVCDMGRGWDKREKFELWMLCVNGKVDESRQIRLLTFKDKNSSRRMRELRSVSFIGIVVLDVD